MSRRRRHATGRAGQRSKRLDTFPARGSRPTKTNCTSDVSAAESAESGVNGQTVGNEVSESYQPEEWWRRKNALVDQIIEERPQRAARPISVRGGTKLRDEAASEKYGEQERYRSETWSTVLNEFLKWYNDYRDAELVFNDPEGEEVRGPMENSHMPEYGDRYYARLKAFERQIIKEYDNPHSVMLTFSGSSENANGGWRCPADHLRDVVESWRPDRGRGVYHVLRDALKGKDWEYAIVVEKHRSGYGHVHCAVIVDGQVREEDFHRVIDTHLRKCEIAGRDAHDYHSPDPDDRPISVNRIQPGTTEDGAIGNLGSYLGEYIGAYGEELFDRGLDELIFRAAAWATGTQIVRFSKGANELIERDRGGSNDDQPKECIRSNPDFDPALHANSDSDVQPFEVENPTWSIVGIARGEGDDEQLFELRRSQVVWREIDDAAHLDPPKSVPFDRPRRRTRSSDLSAF